MWMQETFDRDTIARELRWASEVGFNALRVNLQFLVWKHDRDGLIERMTWFFETASSLGMTTMPVLFDDCGFGGSKPSYGPQPQPVDKIHNSRAVAPPGRAAVMERADWPDYRRYVQDIIFVFKDDSRVLLWDLYNEPGNLMIFTANGLYAEYDHALTEHSRDLMLAAFGWAREIAPSQPLTVAAWRTSPPGFAGPAYDNEIDRLALEYSDAITFHAYCDRAHAEQHVNLLAAQGRPMLSTEWMAPPIDSKFADQLGLYHNRKVGCFSWGLVKGRSQTYLPWPQMLEALHSDIVDENAWFHDVLWPDGRAYDEAEVKLISALTASMTGVETGR